MSGRVALAVVAVVVLAGCGGVPAADGGVESTDTLTPAPMATPTPVPTALRSLPPGVSLNGTVDVDALARAHREAVDGRSFTWTVSYNLTGLSTGNPVQRYGRRVTADATGAYLVETVRPGRYNATLYVDGVAGYAKTSLAEVTNYRRLDYAVGRGYYVRSVEYLRTYLPRTVDLAVVDGDGGRRYRLHATEAPAAVSTRHPNATVADYVATAYVAPDGFVRALSVRYVYTTGGRRYEFALRFDYRAVGEATVEAPAWVDRLRPAGGTDSPGTERTQTRTRGRVEPARPPSVWKRVLRGHW